MRKLATEPRHIPEIRRPAEHNTGTGRDVQKMALRLAAALYQGTGFVFETSLGTAKADHLVAGLLVTLEQERYFNIRARRLHHAYNLWNELKALCLQSGVANLDNEAQPFNLVTQLTPEEIKALARLESAFCYGTNWTITRRDVECRQR